MAVPKKEESGVSQDSKGLARDRIAFGALLGLCILAVFQFLSITSFDTALKIALYCFTLAIPLLTLYLANLLMSSSYEQLANHWYHSVAVVVGGIAPVVGMGAVAWHFSVRLGSAFAVLAFVAAVLFGSYEHSD
jgi:hypothetical protein